MLNETFIVEISRFVLEVCAKIEIELDLSSVGWGQWLSCDIDRTLIILLSCMDSPWEIPPTDSLLQTVTYSYGVM